MKRELIRIANVLEKLGLYSEATVIDKVAGDVLDFEKKRKEKKDRILGKRIVSPFEPERVLDLEKFKHKKDSPEGDVNEWLMRHDVNRALLGIHDNLFDPLMQQILSEYGIRSKTKLKDKSAYPSSGHFYTERIKIKREVDEMLMKEHPSQWVTIWEDYLEEKRKDESVK